MKKHALAALLLWTSILAHGILLSNEEETKIRATYPNLQKRPRIARKLREGKNLQYFDIHSGFQGRYAKLSKNTNWMYQKCFFRNSTTHISDCRKMWGNISERILFLMLCTNIFTRFISDSYLMKLEGISSEKWSKELEIKNSSSLYDLVPYCYSILAVSLIVWAKIFKDHCPKFPMHNGFKICKIPNSK